MNVYMARVNINIAITAMVTEKSVYGNHSSTICMREYELGISQSEFNSTLSEETNENVGRDTFDWTNRQSGLMLGTRAVRSSPRTSFLTCSIYWNSFKVLKRWILLRIRSNDAICWIHFSIFWCPENHDYRYVDVQLIEFWFFLYHHRSKYRVSLVFILDGEKIAL